MARAAPIQGKLRFAAYADESLGQVVTFGTAIFPVERIADAEVLLAKAKESIGLDAAEALHCKVIFHSDARAKTAWGKVEPAAIHGMVRTF